MIKMTSKYNFFILRNYPKERKFIIRKKLKESVFDKIKTLFKS